MNLMQHLRGFDAMKPIHAVYENGVFRPTEPVALPENSNVEIVVRVKHSLDREPGCLPGQATSKTEPGCLPGQATSNSPQGSHHGNTQSAAGMMSEHWTEQDEVILEDISRDRKRDNRREPAP
jgi:predicted DNA-binding antitoxin AbrB/MazE fold protein